MPASWHRRKVGARLRVAIEALNQSPADIGRLFNVSQSKLGNWLRGDHYPDEFFVAAFCDRFNISMDYLYRGRMPTEMAGPLADALWAAEAASSPDQAAAEPQTHDS